ncbi:MAG: hypothetical protein ABJC26_04995 [Gemmatimonadaceae bacterium]
MSAKINTTPYIEQAAANVMVTPVQLIATLDRSFVGPGDTVFLTLSSIPAGKTITGASLAGDVSLRAPVCSGIGCATKVRGAFRVPTQPARLLGASCSGTECEAVLEVSGTITVTANVAGFPKTAIVTIQTQPVPCPTGDSILDNPKLRELIKNLDRIGSKTNPPSEFRGNLWRDSVGTVFFDIDSISAGNTCRQSFYTKTPPAGATLLASAHNHPFGLNRPVTCASAGTFYVRGWKKGLPSENDWDGLSNFNVPNVIIDKNIIARFGPSTLSDSVRKKDPTTGASVWYKVPNQTEFLANYFETTRRPVGCSRP